MAQANDNQTLVFLLLPSPKQKEHLLRTMEAYNLGAQFVAEMSEELDIVNKVVIQPLVYARLRSEFRLPSEIAVRAISKAIETRKADIQTVVRSWRRRETRSRETERIPPPQIDPHSPMMYSASMLSFPNVHSVSMLCLEKREQIPARYCYYAPPGDDPQKARGELIYDEAQNVFFLHHYRSTTPRQDNGSEAPENTSLEDAASDEAAGSPLEGQDYRLIGAPILVTAGGGFSNGQSSSLPLLVGGRD